MADLETAAAMALAAIRAFESQSHAAIGRIRQLQEGPLQAIEHQCEGTWTTLRQQVNSFLEHAAAKRSLVDELGQDALRDLAALRDSVSASYRDAEADVEQASEGTKHLGEQVAAADPELAAWRQAYEETARALESQLTSLEQDLQQTILEARTFIGSEVVQALTQMREQAVARAAEVQGVLAQSEQSVNAAEADWSAKLDDVLQAVVEAFGNASTHAEAVAAFAVEDCERAFNETTDALVKAAETLTGAMDALKSEAESAAKDVSGDAAALEADVHQTVEALEAADSIVADLIELMAQYTFEAGT